MKKIHKNGQEANQLITDMVKRFAVSTGKSLVDNCNNFSLPTGLRIELDDALDQLDENYIGLQDEHEPIYDAFAESIKRTGKIVSTPLKISKKKQKTIAVLSTGEFPLRQNLILEERREKELLPPQNIFLPEDYEPDRYGIEEDNILRSRDFARFADILGYDYADDNMALDSIQIMETFFKEYNRQVEEKKDEEFLEMIHDPGLPMANTKFGLPKDLNGEERLFTSAFSLAENKNNTIRNEIPKGDTMNEERDENGVVRYDPQENLETKVDETTKKSWYKKPTSWLAGATLVAAAVGYSMCGSGPAPLTPTPTPTPTAVVQQYTPTPVAEKTPAPVVEEESVTAKPNTAELYMSNGMGLWHAAEKFEIEDERIVPFIEHHQEKFGLKGDTLRVTKNADGTGTWENCDDGLIDSIKEGTYEFDLNFDGKVPVPHYTGMTNTARTPTPCVEEATPVQTPTPAPVVTPKPKVTFVMPEKPSTQRQAIADPEPQIPWIQEQNISNDFRYVDGPTYIQVVGPAPKAPRIQNIVINEAPEQEPVIVERKVERVEYKVPKIKHVIPDGPLKGWDIDVRAGVGDFNIARTFEDGAEEDEAYGTNWFQIGLNYADQNTNFKALVAKTQGQEELGREYDWLPIAQPGFEIEGLAAAVEWEEKLFSTGKNKKGPFVSLIGGAQYTSAENKYNWGFGTQDTFHEQNNLEGKVGIGIGVGRFDDSYARVAAVAVAQEITDETCGYCGIDSDSAIEVTPRVEVDLQKVFKNKEGKAKGVVRAGFDLGINELIWTNDEHELVDGWHGNFKLEAGKIWNTKGGNQIELGATFKVFGDYSDFKARPSALEDFDVNTHGKSIGAYIKYRF